DRVWTATRNANKPKRSRFFGDFLVPILVAASGGLPTKISPLASIWRSADICTGCFSSRCGADLQSVGPATTFVNVAVGFALGSWELARPTLQGPAQLSTIGDALEYSQPVPTATSFFASTHAKRRNDLAPT